MLENNTIIKVKNRDNGTVGYVIPDLGNLHRSFQPHEEKDISYEELKKLSYLPGGNVILKDYLIIENEDAVAELLGEVEPEYNYTEEDIKNILERGSVDQLLDALDFAPSGVIDLIKDMAVKIELNDVRKREAILQKTGFNVTSAIEINKETAETSSEATQTRRTTPITETAASKERRTGNIIIPKKK